MSILYPEKEPARGGPKPLAKRTVVESKFKSWSRFARHICHTGSTVMVTFMVTCSTAAV